MIRILLVEDQPTLRQLVSEVLELSGYQVTVASDGEKALELLKSETFMPDLILSDLLMEPIGGAQLLEHIRNEWMMRDIPFVMMTGQDQIAELHPDLRHEIDGYITKPFGIKDILTAVQQRLAKSQRKNRDHQEGNNASQRFA